MAETAKVIEAKGDNVIHMLKSINKPEIYEEVSTVGSHIIDRNRSEWSLRKAKIRDIATGSEGSKLLSSRLVDMRTKANKINRIADVKGFRKWFTTESKIITKALVRYEDIEKSISKISEALVTAREMLHDDANELREVSSWIKDQMDDIKLATDTLKAMIEHVKTSDEIPLEELEKDQLEELLATRCQDLSIMLSAYEQFRVTISQTIFNSHREIQTADRMEMIVTTVADTGLIIKAAMNRQKDVNKLNQSAKDLAADLIKQNAIDLKEQTGASKRSYNDMSNITDSLKEAYTTISQALAEESVASKEHTDAVLKNIADLDNLQEKLESALSSQEEITPEGE